MSTVSLPMKTDEFGAARNSFKRWLKKTQDEIWLVKSVRDNKGDKKCLEKTKSSFVAARN